MIMKPRYYFMNGLIVGVAISWLLFILCFWVLFPLLDKYIVEPETSELHHIEIPIGESHHMLYNCSYYYCTPINEKHGFDIISPPRIRANKIKYFQNHFSVVGSIKYNGYIVILDWESII